MIITCPNCSTRYTLPQEKIRLGGQKVRCAKCGHVWHQMPEPEEAALVEPAPPPETDTAPAWSDEPAAESAAAEPTPTPPVDVPEGPEPEGEPPPTEDRGDFAAYRPPEPPPSGDDLRRFRASQEAEQEAAEQRSSNVRRGVVIGLILLLLLAIGVVLVFRDRIEALTGINLHPAPPAEETAPAPAPETVAPAATAPQALNLVFDDVESSIEESDGVKRLTVKGTIVNPGDTGQAIPPLSFEMLDADGRTIDHWVFKAPVETLAPHTTTRFMAQRDTPPATLHELVPGFASADDNTEGTPPEAQPGPDASAPEAPTH
ncbi:MAG: DUF3426 domain-containing protein [Alphaproteobacteria bacterium]|nr:DUF3426 domain-containing protein [Alphaproteobacteria bacterium]